MVQMHELKPASGAKKKCRRVGRGDGSKRGTYSGRGSKGQKARSKVSITFEGGQLPLVKKLPAMRGNRNPNKIIYTPINLVDLNDFESSVNLQTLKEKGLIHSLREKVKILGNGELKNSVEISAHGFSKSALQKIENRGGKAIIIQNKQRSGSS